MINTEGKGIWKGLSSISFIISVIVLGLGLDKMFNYENGESIPYEYHNAYVGGDAYNYIINGNYATGFFVLAAMFALMGIGFIVLYYLSKMADGQEKLPALVYKVKSDEPPGKADKEVLHVCNSGIVKESAQNKDLIIVPETESESCIGKKEVHFSNRDSEKVVCPICGTSQNSNRRVCFHCGAKFVFDDEM